MTMASNSLVRLDYLVLTFQIRKQNHPRDSIIQFLNKILMSSYKPETN